LQRSLNGNDFKAIGIVQANGNDGSKKNYDYIDKDAFQQKSTTLYYRLKIIDRNGSNSFSRLAFINFGTALVKGPEVLPNPAGDLIKINYYSAFRQGAEIRIINDIGQVVKSVKYNFSKGNNQQEIRIENFASGIYFIQLSLNGNLTSTMKFIKK
jgi:hypothetical protein